jgi:hypothetical protein
MMSQFENQQGLPEGFIEEWDRPLAGFVTKDGAYGFQTTDGDFWLSDDVDDPEERLDDLQSDLTERTVEEEETEITDGVKSQLEDLGYA